MSMYRLKLLGDIQLTDPAGAIAMPGRKLKAIIAYLALNGDSALPREHLAAMFWPEASTQQTRQNLRRMLARAKALFGADASEFLATEHESIMLATTWLAVRVAGLSSIPCSQSRRVPGSSPAPWHKYWGRTATIQLRI